MQLMVIAVESRKGSGQIETDRRRKLFNTDLNWCGTLATPTSAPEKLIT